MAQTQRFLGSRRWSSVEEVNRLLSSPGGQEALAGTPPTTRIEKAQEKAYDAWEADGEARYRLAREALGLDEQCSDVWLILAERERSWAKQRKCFEKAVALSKQVADAEGWLTSFDETAGEESEEEPVVDLYSNAVARPFLRARMALARCLMDGGYFKESQALYEELMTWDRDDHLGARYEVMQIYHEMDNLRALSRLLRQYAHDMTAPMAYERLWLALAKGSAPSTVARLERAARKANPHVPAFLGLRRRSQSVDGIGTITLGGEDEAAHYAGMALFWWLELPEARAWVEAAVAESDGI